LFTDPPSTIGFWIALEDTTTTNGCLWVVPGSHKQPVSRRFVRTPEGKSTTFVGEDKLLSNHEGVIAVPVRKGTCVIIHGTVNHFSYENHSDRSRHATTVHVIEGAYGYPDDNWLQTSAPAMKLTGDR
jgi:phytanoyl-CoA hydroxylase